MPKIGIIHSGRGVLRDQQTDVATFIQSLAAAGYVDGKNGFSILPPIPAYGNDDAGQLLGHAKNFVGQGVDVLVAAGGSISAQVAQKATEGTPTKAVFTSAAYQTSPAQNMTGICARTAEVDPTRLFLLHELMPNEINIGVLIASRPNNAGQMDALNSAARTLGLNLNPTEVDSLGKIQQAFKDWAPAIKAAVVTANPLFNDFGPEVVKAANRNNVAAIYQWRQFVDADGLMSYGTTLSDGYKLAGTYTGLVLNKQPPQALPVVLLTKFELAINLRTAGSLGITVPQTLLDRADYVVRAK
jgi:ABC-type uncharacterized transport system substrate-binding protein